MKPLQNTCKLCLWVVRSFLIWHGVEHQWQLPNAHIKVRSWFKNLRTCCSVPPSTLAAAHQRGRPQYTPTDHWPSIVRKVWKFVLRKTRLPHSGGDVPEGCLGVARRHGGEMFWQSFLILKAVSKGDWRSASLVGVESLHFICFAFYKTRDVSIMMPWFVSVCRSNVSGWACVSIYAVNRCWVDLLTQWSSGDMDFQRCKLQGGGRNPQNSVAC